MAVVGDAYIVVRAITNRVRPQIQSAFSGLGDIGDKAGSDVSEGFNRGLSKGGGAGSVFTKKFENDAEQARVKLRSLTQAGFFAGPAFTALGGAIGALGSGIVTLGVVAGAAAQGGLLVLGGSVAALIQGATTLKLAFSGVAAAITAGNKASSGGASQAKAIEAANKRLAQAQLSLFRVEEDRLDQIADIKRANADAQRAAADAVISAKRSDRAYQDSVRNTQKVIESVTKARKDAVEALQQLRFETEGGAISEKKARIEFEKARDSLQRVQDLPPNSRARQEAELAFAEADLNLRQAIDRNADLKNAEKEKTVEVAKMQQKTIMDTQEVKDAQLDQAQAAEDSARAQIDANQAVVDAANAAGDLKSGKAFKDINRTLADAKEAVKEARKDLLDAEKGGGAASAFADAMAKLSPEAQKFVKFIIGLRGEFDKLKAAAGKELFPKLETAIQNLVDNLFPKLIPLLQGTGGVLGDIAIGFSNTVTKAENIKRLESIWKTNDELLGKFGLAANNLYENFLILLDAAKPLIDAFGDWIVEVTGAWNATLKADEASGALNEKMLRIKDVLGGLGKAGGDFWKALKDIFSVIMEEGGAADVLVGYLKDAASNFKDFIAAGKEDGSLKEFFVTATENFTKILDLIGNIIGELMKVGNSPGTGQFIDSLNKVVDTFGLIGQKLGGKDGPTAGLGKLLEGFADLSLKLTESGTIEMFFKVLQGALDVANAIFGNTIVQKVLAFTGVFIGLAKGAGLVFRVLKFIGTALTGNVLKVFTMIKDPFGALRKGSGLTRDELKKQMVVDKQKKDAMNGIFTSGKQAARGVNLLKSSSEQVTPKLTLATRAAKIKAGAMKGLGTAGRIAGAGMKAAGRGLGALFGGPIGIILLLLPLIIENWDSIVAFFKDLIPKLGKIFSDMWSGLTSFLGDAWKNISTWFTETFVPGLADFGLMVLDVLTWILFPLPKLILKFWPEISGFFTNVIFPWFASLPKVIGDFVAGVWDFFSKGVAIAWDAVVWYFTTIWNFYRDLPGKVIGFAGKVWEFLSTGVQTAWRAVSGWWNNTVVPWFSGLVGKVVNLAGKVWQFLSTGLSNAWGAVTSFFTQTVPSFLKSIPGKFASALSGLWDAIGGGLQAAWATAKAWWNNNVASKKLTIGGFKVLGVQIPKIELGFPRLAKGGIIPATPGGTMAMIGEAGKAERVEPLDANGLSKRDKAMIDYMSGGAGGGVTIIVNPSAGMDEKELADLVSRKLAQQMRMGAA